MCVVAHSEQRRHREQVVYTKPFLRLRSVLSIVKCCNKTTFRAQVVPNFGDRTMWRLFRFFLFQNSVNRYLKFSRTEHSKISFSVLGAKTWNRISNCLHSLPKYKFKRMLHNPLLNILIQEYKYVGIHSLIDKFRNLYSLNLKHLLVIIGLAHASGLFIS